MNLDTDLQTHVTIFLLKYENSYFGLTPVRIILQQIPQTITDNKDNISLIGIKNVPQKYHSNLFHLLYSILVNGGY